ncbi:helix-turn-helix domain-containing protein [Micrococcus luteus]|uniref:helix-turn-helix domain-containing protein n=1 Tax=Micrococcus luteus TaxID=1270 RepID=UPI0011A5E005|nr:helix-turn-helix transcriptional regulator [Micrococcus luteus]
MVEGIVRHALAAALGVSQSGISHRLRARVAFTLEELATIAGWLDITLAELFGPVVLQARRSPRTDMVGAGASGSLPRLDSNQQPFDYLSPKLINDTVKWTIALTLVLTRPRGRTV